MNKKLNGVTEALVQAIMKIRFEDLPEEDVEKAELVLLDAIGCALASQVVDRSRLAIELVKEFGGNPQATIIGNHRTSYGLASFANGELINAIEYDCLGPLTAHVCPFVLPPCLAIAERVHATGKELILALALALEVGGRMMSSLAQLKVLKEEPPYYEDAQRFTYANALFGGVAGACKLLKLDVRRTLNAFGIAGASAPVPAVMKWEETTGPAIMVKYNAWTGWGAQLATVAALLSEKGFTGDTTILDGEWGYWKIVGSPFFNIDNLLGGLGKVWHITEVHFKPYPICGVNHAGIEGINRIVQEHQIRPEEVEEIVVKADPLLQTPNRRATEIKSFADVQFLNAYIFAIAACYGDKPNPGWLMPLVYNDPRVKILSKKVRVEVHPQAGDLMSNRIKAGKLPVFWDTIVEIMAKGGRRFTVEIPIPKGNPANPMTEKDLVEKFKTNASYSILPSSRVENIIQMVMGLAELDDITRLTRLLTI